MNDPEPTSHDHGIADEDPAGQSGRPFIVSGVVLTLLLVLAVLVVVGVLVTG